MILGIYQMGIGLTKTYQFSCHLKKITHSVSERLLHDLLLSTNIYQSLMTNIPTPENFKKLSTSSQQIIRFQYERITSQYCLLFENQLCEG